MVICICPEPYTEWFQILRFKILVCLKCGLPAHREFFDSGILIFQIHEFDEGLKQNWIDRLIKCFRYNTKINQFEELKKLGDSLSTQSSWKPVEFYLEEN